MALWLAVMGPPGIPIDLFHLPKSRVNSNVNDRLGWQLFTV
jgi:hypothetical protein